jgi:hypothetical protein
MNFATDCLIEFIKSVINKKKDPFIILQTSDKNDHQIIAGDVLPGSLL